MFERFTGGARQALALAREEASLLNYHQVGTEHILLGLVREGNGVAAKTLESAGVSLEGVRGKVLEMLGRGMEPASRERPLFTANARNALVLAAAYHPDPGAESGSAVWRAVPTQDIDTGDLLLGLIDEAQRRDPESLAALIGASLDEIRRRVHEADGVQRVGSTTNLDLDDVVTLCQLIEGVVGRPLTADESSKLKAAYQHTRTSSGGATLDTLARVLSRPA